LWIIALFLIIAAAVYFRFTGLFWGEYSFLHPDERFFIQVTSHIAPVESLGAYFDTARSTLNPHNVGDTFFVYGTFPIIATRYIANAVFTDVFWEQLLQTGRTFSAVMDLVTVLLVYLLGTRLFNRKIGVLGAAFSAFAVMQIQQSHFFTADSFSTTFTTLALYFAARLATQPVLEPSLQEEQKWYKSESARNSLWFGVAMGFAMACKINTALMVVLLPAAWFIYLMRHPHGQRDALMGTVLRDMVIGAAGTFLLFRIFNPYAFSGPGFLGLIPNEKSRWYFGDVLIPAVGAASVVLLAQQFQPASHQNRLAWLAFLIITGCLALVASTAMAKRTRLLLLAAVRNAFHVPT